MKEAEEEAEKAKGDAPATPMTPRKSPRKKNKVARYTPEGTASGEESEVNGLEMER